MSQRLTNREAIEDYAEHWLDLGREEVFAEVSQFLGDLYDESPDREPFRRWFFEWFNASFKLEGDRTLSMDDVSSLVLRSCNVQSAGDIAGVEITRPVFLFLHKSEYSDFLGKLYGRPEISSSSAVNLKFNTKSVNKSPFETTGFLLAGDDGGRTNANISHEVRHSIDPHLYARKGYDDIITEGFAFYTDHIDRPDAYKTILYHYHKRFSEGVTENEKMTKEAYNELVDRFVDDLVLMKKQLGAINAARSLVQSSTIDEFFNCGFV